MASDAAFGGGPAGPGDRQVDVVATPAKLLVWRTSELVTIQAVFPVLLEHADETLILHYSWPELSDRGDLDPTVAQGLEVLENWLRAARRGEEDGSMASPVPAQLLVRIINSAMISLVDRYRYETLDGGAEPIDVVAMVDGLVELLVRPALVGE